MTGLRSFSQWANIYSFYPIRSRSLLGDFPNGLRDRIRLSSRTNSMGVIIVHGFRVYVSWCDGAVEGVVGLFRESRLRPFWFLF